MSAMNFQLSLDQFRFAYDLLQLALSFVIVINAANTLFPPLFRVNITPLPLLPPIQDIHCF